MAAMLTPTLAELFALLRKRQKLTQKALAERAGLSASTIMAIERGSLGVTLDSLEKVSVALGVVIRVQLVEDNDGK